jgi:very-short-patch-repair endonuclease
MIDERAFADLVRRHHGIVTTSQLSALGISRHQQRWLLGIGRLDRISRGVFAVGIVSSGLRREAAALTATAGALRYPTAAAVWGFRKVPRSHEVHVVVPATRRPTAPPGVRIFRTRCLPAQHLTERSGLQLTSVPRTLFDAAAVVPRMILVSMIDQALAARWCTTHDLGRVARETCEPHRRGSHEFSRVLADRLQRRGVARSDDELVVAEALRRAGAPEPIANFTWQVPNGLVIHGDLVWPDLRVWLEIDHHTWHSGRFEQARDKQRDRWLTMEGWVVLRITDHDIEARLASVVDEVLTVLRRRAAVM